ncbi:MAG: hypothetical protein JNL58_17000 [Planctomyces sp.]|nr:hypothetical protein [Planctomyces sp.]
MALKDELEQIYPQLASALIEATPEWWTHATLELECPPEGLGSGLSHSISNADFPQDVVVATDEVMLATRMLELCSKRHSDTWTRFVFQIRQEGDNWRFDASFED